jgi:hypothetical protein
MSLYAVQIVYAADSPEEAQNVRNFIETALLHTLGQLPPDNQISAPLVGSQRELS